MARTQHRFVKIADYNGKKPPLAIEAEAGLLGSCILDSDKVGELFGTVEAADFWEPKHQTLWEALVRDYDRGGKTDLVRLVDDLNRRGALDAVGGQVYMVELAESVPSPASANYYASLVKDASRRRRLIEYVTTLADECYESGRTADELEGMAFDELLKLGEASTMAEVMGRSELIVETADEVGNRRSTGDDWMGYQTHIPELDNLLVGLEPGTMTILGARPSVGKTALGLQIADAVANQGGKPLFFVLEMSKRQVGYRDLASRTGLPAWKIRRPSRLADWDMEAMEDRGRHVDDLPPLIYAITPGLTVGQFRSMTTHQARAKKCGFAVIDYLGLMQTGKAENRNLALGEVSRAVKRTALELDIPVLVLAQLNRASEKEGRKPRLSDLRDSGEIEQDADNVMFIHREEMRKNRERDDYTPRDTEHAEIILEKNRNGPCGIVEVEWVGQHMRFWAKEDYEHRSMA